MSSHRIEVDGETIRFELDAHETELQTFTVTAPGVVPFMVTGVQQEALRKAKGLLSAVYHGWNVDKATRKSKDK